MEHIMSFDDTAWEKSEEIADAWLEKLHDRHVYVVIKDFILTYRDGKPIEVKDSSSVILRIPIPGLSRFPEEKVRNEVATMKYLREHTTIPVPTIFHWGSRAESPLELGPFILMEFIEHATTLANVLKIPGKDKDARPILNPKLDVEHLKNLYQQIADALLQLSRQSFPTIGSILINKDGKDFDVCARPLSMYWNELVRLGDLPETELPDTVFTTSTSYLKGLADLHIKHLLHQPNNSISSESDCRQKFLARILFRKLAEDKKLVSSGYEHGPFTMWCDDLRPGNVILDSKYQIVGIVNWEFTYAAPTEFTSSPPWWLLLEKPEFWPGGISNWTQAYEHAFHIFLSALRSQEEVAINKGNMTRNKRLSACMEHEWATGRFWVIYAATRSFAFDPIFRQVLDRIYFEFDSSWEDDWESRMQILSPSERDELEILVRRKLAAVESKV
ncbi:phosphotransferase family protein [Aspergillus coremiiformis]|uniref:Phosphotransferase family protein n=1 Tax=Aspergillus coremiiformis TaxID=138285 RepID=A0A5N6Z2M3_9EURO|nr:phosphotransferase family protein [Aspergillus coremiiformis]